MEPQEIRYIVETGLDLHVVSNVQLDGNNLRLTIINPTKISTLEIPVESVTRVIKENVVSEDVTSTFIKELVTC